MEKNDIEYFITELKTIGLFPSIKNNEHCYVLIISDENMPPFTELVYLNDIVGWIFFIEDLDIRDMNELLVWLKNHKNWKPYIF